MLNMLDILIAIFLIYALFAGLVSSISELIIQALSLRGRVLFEGIALMLGELTYTKYRFGILKPFAIKNTKLTEALYRHPLIDSLSPDDNARPSYIAPQIFSSALVQVLSKDGSVAALSRALDDRSKPIGKLLGPMLDEASGDLEKFKARVEAHFSAVTDRASGWFKRRTQCAMFFIGLLLAILLNVDTIYIGQQLQRNPDAVKSLVEAAGKASASATAAAEKQALDQSFQTEIAKLNTHIMEFKQLPVGWYFPITDAEQSSSKASGQPATAKQGPSISEVFELIGFQLVEPMKWLGWLLTALAGTLGAPFWFDAISKLFAIRGAGKKPGETAPPVTPISVQVSTPATAVIAPQDVPLNDYEAGRLNGDDIEALQKALGMLPAKINGRLSEELRQALREWQRTTGRTVTGQFDEPTVLTLLYPESQGA
ncbi:MAG: peptidoglycan-binding protein [Nitrosomonas sp.]|nr:MAG: peptidoglycan-binding protein [Nitrosomonas sp.]